MEYNLHKMMQQQRQTSSNNRMNYGKTGQGKPVLLHSQLNYAQVNLYESPLQRANGINNNSTGGSQARMAAFSGAYNVMGSGGEGNQAGVTPPHPSVSKFENNNKTRNLTQIPSLKSSPVQRGMLMPNMPQEEDFVDDELNMQTDEGWAQIRQPKNYIQMSERRNAPMNLELFQNLQHPQRPHIPLYNQRFSGIVGTSKNGQVPISHQRGQSLFEVKRATAHLTNGLANHQQLQKRALESGELGLEEHVPITPPLQSAAYGGKAGELESEEEDEDQDANDVDEMCVDPYSNHLLQHAETEQDLDGQTDGAEDEDRVDTPSQQLILQQQQQDSPGLQIIKLEQGSSQEGNIPRSSNSSSAKKSPHNKNYHQSVSSFKNKISHERISAHVEGFLQKSSEKFKACIIQPKEITETFKINPCLVSISKPGAGGVGGGVVNSSATPNQPKFQSSFSMVTHQPLHKQSSYSSFMKAQSSSQATQNNSMIKRVPSHQKKQNCNETVEDENDVDVAVSPNPMGVATHQSFNMSSQHSYNRKKISEVPPSIVIPFKPPMMNLQDHSRKPNTACSSIISAPGDTQSLLQSIHSRVIQYNERERGRDRSRSNSEQKVGGKLQKLESKNLIKDEISPIATNFGSTKQKLDLPEVVFTSFNGSTDKGRKNLEQPKVNKDDQEKFGDLSLQPQANFIGPNPAILKNQSAMLAGKLVGRAPSISARPNGSQFDQDDHLIDPKDLETEQLRVEYLKLKKTLNQLKYNNASVQQFDTKRSLDKRKSDLNQMPLVVLQKPPEQPQHNEAQPPIIVESFQASKVISPKEIQPKSRVARPNSSCLTEKQPKLIPSTIQSEFNFSNGISQQEPPPSASAAVKIESQVKRQFINLETTQGCDDMENQSRSPLTSSQEKLMKKSNPADLHKAVPMYAKHHSNTTKISRRRQLNLKNNQQEESFSSYDDGLTATIQKCIEGSGAVHDQVTESENGVGVKHLIISTLKQSKVSKVQEIESKMTKSVEQHHHKGAKPKQGVQRRKQQQQISYNQEVSEDDGDYSSSSYLAEAQYNTAPRRKGQSRRHRKYSPDEGDDEYESSEQQRVVAKKSKKHGRGGAKNVENKSRKDRKQLKININMNSVTGAPSGNQYGKQEPNLLKSNEELMQRLQQQQLLLAQITTQAYANPQNFLLQQQLALQQQQILMSQSLMHPTSYIGGGMGGIQSSHCAQPPFGLPQANFMGLTPNPAYSHQGMQSQMGASTFSDLTSSNFGGNPMHTQSMHIPPSSSSQQQQQQQQQNTQFTKSKEGNNVFFSTHDEQNFMHQQQMTQRSHYQDDTIKVDGTPSPAQRNAIFSNLRQVINSGNGEGGSSGAHKNKGVSGGGNYSVLNRLASPKDLRFDDFSNPPAGNSRAAGVNGQQQQSTKPGANAGSAAAGEGRAQQEYQVMASQKQVHSRNIPISQNYSSPIKNLIAVAIQGESHPRHYPEEDPYKKQTSTYDRTLMSGDDGQKHEMLCRTIDSLHAKNIRVKAVAPLLEQKRTGQFGAQQIEKREMLLIQNQGEQHHLNAESSSQESLDEGLPIKSTVLHDYNQKSATPSQIYISPKKTSQIVLVPQNGLSSLDQTSQYTPETTLKKFGDSPMKLLNREHTQLQKDGDQERKEPILIGFDDVSQVKDPFQNKPALKPREKPVVSDAKKLTLQQLSARSKSAKGTSSQISATSCSLVSRQALGKAEKELKAKQDSQYTSPMRAGTAASLASPSKDQAMSQMKRAVIILKKDLDSQTIKASSTPIEIKLSAQKRPATSKYAIGSAKSSITTEHHQAFSHAVLATNAPRVPIKERITAAFKKDQTPSLSIKLDAISKQPKVLSSSHNDAQWLPAEVEDARHNQNLGIEIFDRLSKKNAQQNDDEPSLAEIFKQKKKNVVEKLMSRKFHTGQSQEDQDLQHDSPDQDYQLHASRPLGKFGGATKKAKSKEELFQLRKQMMKSKLKPSPVNHFQGPAAGNSGHDLGSTPTRSQETHGGVDNKNGLMTRLAQGKKTQIDKREMKRLTNKNYQNLPEIKKKRQEEAKKLENQARKAATQEYLKQLDETRKKKAAAVQRKRAQGLE